MIGRSMSLRRQLAATVPGVRSLVTTLDRTRDERDRLREERDRLLAERGTSREEHAASRQEHAASRRERRERREAAVLREEEVRADTLSTPSFYARYESMLRVRALVEEQAGERHPVWRSDPKHAGRDLARSLGVAVPRLLAAPAPLAELQPPEASRFVLKPVRGSTSHGVFALVATEDGRYRSILDRLEHTWDEVIDLAREAMTVRPISQEFLVEELVDGPGDRELPFDWKCYCLGGRVELVMQKDARNRRKSSQARFKFWSTAFEDLGPIRHADRLDRSLPPPEHPEALVAAAEAIAGALPGVFVRVDLFDTPEGVVFGEITPHPGGRQLFVPEVDRALGEAWERAEASDTVQRYALGTA
jgi:glutathione synthase/RimK-type ligase-like ATP-grasp enzyme